MKNIFNNDKQLPKIYKSKVYTENNKKCFYSKNEDIDDFIRNYPKYDKETIKMKINLLLNTNTLYSNELTLLLKNKKIRTRIIRKFDSYILTIDNDKILYDDIIDILE